MTLYREIQSVSLSRSLPRSVAASLFVLFCGGCLLRPPAVVDVEVRNVPEGAGKLGLSADLGGKFEPMSFAVHMLDWEPMPANHYLGGHDGYGPGKVYWTQVYWVQGDKVGLVTSNSPEGWSVHWFLPPKNRRTGSWLLAGGTWYCDYENADEVEPLTPDEIKRFNAEK